MPKMTKRTLANQMQTDFLVLEYELCANNLWECYDRIWGIYKFYITIISGLVGLLIAVITFGIELTSLYIAIMLISFIIFALGLSFLNQAIKIDSAAVRNYTRITAVSEKIALLANLEDYFEKIKSQRVEWAYWKRPNSFKDLLKSAILNSGVKTQITLINSLFCTLFIISLLFLSNLSMTFINLLLIATGSYILFLLLHGLVALFRIKNEGLIL